MLLSISMPTFTTAASSLIPWEIRDAIIDQLTFDRKALGQCYLVSKQWLSHARGRYFANYEACLAILKKQNGRGPFSQTFRIKLEDCKLFIKLLHAPNSTLASYIQRLCILGLDRLSTPHNKDLPQEYEQGNSLIMKELPLLRRIRFLALQNITWNRILPEVKTVIGSLHHVISVTSITMSCSPVVEFLEFCSINFPKLQALKIQTPRRYYTQDDDALSFVKNHFTHLRVLDLVESDLFPNILPLYCDGSVLAYIQPQNITTLHFTIGHGMFGPSSIGRFIQAVGTSLQFLSLDIASSAHLEVRQKTEGLENFPISLKQNTSLQTLEFVTLFPLYRSDVRLPQIIRTIASPKLEEITLCIFDSLLHPENFTHFIGHLKHSLVGCKDLPKSATVCLKVSSTRPWEVVQRELEEQTKGLLPDFCSQGQVVIRVEGQIEREE